VGVLCEMRGRRGLGGRRLMSARSLEKERVEGMECVMTIK
jgi:hypothetical protein